MSDYPRLFVEAYNFFDEIYLHVEHGLVDSWLVLDAIGVITLAFFYACEPILSEIEEQSRYDFGNLRRLALMSQHWVREHEPKVDPLLLDFTFSAPSR